MSVVGLRHNQNSIFIAWLASLSISTTQFENSVTFCREKKFEWICRVILPISSPRWSKLKRKQLLGSPCVFLPHLVLFCHLTIELFYIVYKLDCVFGNPLSLFPCLLYVRRQQRSGKRKANGFYNRLKQEGLYKQNNALKKRFSSVSA